MDLSNTTMELINTAIEAYLKEKEKQAELYNADPVNFIPLPPTLTLTLNTAEINYAEEELRRTNEQIMLVKIPYGNYSKIYYYKHPKGDFVVGLDNDGNIVSLS
jgi:hypothetical protein